MWVFLKMKTINYYLLLFIYFNKLYCQCWDYMSIRSTGAYVMKVDSKIGLGTNPLGYTALLA